MFVYVLDSNNRPLMPTKRFGKVRRIISNEYKQGALHYVQNKEPR